MKRYQMHDIVTVVKLRDNRFDKFTPWGFSCRPPHVGDVGTIVTVPTSETDSLIYCVECMAEHDSKTLWLEYMYPEEIELNRSIDEMLDQSAL